MAIQSFSDKDTKEFFCKGKIGKGVKWKIISTVAQRKLDIVHYAEFLHDLKSPPNNQREALKSNLKGLHSIRINDQWGLVFRWTSKGPEEVKIMDYHK